MGLSFYKASVERLNLQVHTALNEVRKRKTTMIVFPELSLPNKYLKYYVGRMANERAILVGGVEYTSDNNKNAYNSTIISIPVDRKADPFGRAYISFEQVKHYPAAFEKRELKPYKYMGGESVFLFKSDQIGSFANLTCSDFLSLRMRLKVQELVHFLLVPAQNPDNSTYDHLAQSCIRDLHSFAVICNSQFVGTSLIYGPLYDQTKRTLLKREGISHPEFASLTWNPMILKISQTADSQVPFRPKEKKKKRKSDEYRLADFKQTPPDFGK